MVPGAGANSVVSQWHLWRWRSRLRHTLYTVGPVSPGQWPAPPDLPQVTWGTAVVVGLSVVEIGIHLKVVR